MLLLEALDKGFPFTYFTVKKQHMHFYTDSKSAFFERAQKSFKDTILPMGHEDPLQTVKGKGLSTMSQR